MAQNDTKITSNYLKLPQKSLKNLKIPQNAQNTSESLKNHSNHLKITSKSLKTPQKHLKSLQKSLKIPQND
jgi:hypothetical protein